MIQITNYIYFIIKHLINNYIQLHHFFGFKSDSHFNTSSNRFWLFADILKHATVLSFKLFSYIFSITYSSCIDPIISFLFPKTNKGIPARLLFCKSSCIWARATSAFALFNGIDTLIVWIKNKDDYIWISTKFLPWLSKTSLSSQVPQLHWYFALIRRGVPFLISWWLNPMVGIESYSKVPSVIAFTKVVLPAFCSPTMAIYNYLLKNRVLIQSRTLLKNPNMVQNLYYKYYLISIYV